MWSLIAITLAIIFIIYNIVCIPITFNNPIKACFSNKKYHLRIQKHTTQILNSIFLIDKPVLQDF